MRIYDARALLGGVALLLTGAIVSTMGFLFVTYYQPDDSIFYGRWMWEIIMNLQILAVAFMWFCYADRIYDAHPVSVRKFKRYRLLGLGGVLLPSFIALLFVSKEFLASITLVKALDSISMLMVLYWFVTAVLRNMVSCGPGQTKPFLHTLLGPSVWSQLLLPVFWGVTIIYAHTLSPEKGYYVWLPVSLYLHAALPYFYSGFTKQDDAVA